MVKLCRAHTKHKWICNVPGVIIMIKVESSFHIDLVRLNRVLDDIRSKYLDFFRTVLISSSSSARADHITALHTKHTITRGPERLDSHDFDRFSIRNTDAHRDTHSLSPHR